MTWRREQQIMDRFQTYVALQGDCWIWTGNYRYGHPYFHRGKQNGPARRFAYVHVYGPIPLGHICLSSCGDTRCVAPHHTAVRRKSTRRGTGVPTGRKSVLGRELEACKGGWTAGGHQFGEDLRCKCGRTFAQHQVEPLECPMAVQEAS